MTDRRRLAPDARTTAEEFAALEGLIEEAIDEGAGAVQIRERDAPAGVLADFVRRVMARRGTRATRVLVNDRADIAVTAGADGVHLRADSLPASRVRDLRPSWIVGRSVHGPESRALSETLDYLLFGTVFPSASKPDRTAAGLTALTAVVKASRVPVVAIGGISTAAAAAACIQTGAVGIAAIGVFLPEGRAPGAMGVRQAVRVLSQAVADSRP